MNTPTEHTENQAELDAFFNWLLPLLPKANPKEPPPPSPQLLDLAWETAQAHQNYLWDNGLYHETIYPAWAADDGVHQKNAPINIQCCEHQGVHKGILVFEMIPGNEDEQLLSFKCLEGCIAEFEGRQIEIGISGRTYALGEVDWEGQTEPKIVPSGIYLQEMKVNKK